jgi:glycosyltransferase involved in cell wall biosynthesis
VQAGGVLDHDRLKVALDATPLLGVRTGVGSFCAGALGALAVRAELDVMAFAVSWRRRHELMPLLPQGVRSTQRAMPARPLHLAWSHVSGPSVERFIGPVDVVHGTNYVVPPTRRAARVVTVHDLTTVRYPQLCDGPSLEFPRLVRRAVNSGAWVHTPSRFVAEEVVAEFGIEPERVHAVYLGIPVHGGGARDETDDADAALAGQLPAGTERYVLALGTIEPRKDYPSLVHAFGILAEKLDDVALVIAGPDGWGADALEAALGASRRRGRIVRLGHVPSNRFDRLLARAAVVAYPSVYEGFGLVPLEAMAAGVPVVATAAGAVPEVTGDGALLVPPRDVDALAEALLKTLCDEAERAALVERGLHRAGSFTWEKCAAGLADLYAAAYAASAR